MSLALARKYQFQVSPDNTTWTNVKAISDLAPTENPTIADATTYDTNGIAAAEKTLIAPKIIAKFMRPSTGGVADPGQELIRGTRFQFGLGARLYARWFDRTGAADAYAGYAVVEWEQSKTGVTDLEEVTATFTFDGIFTSITNPYTVTTVPVIASITPSGAGSTTSVAIIGSGFTGLVATTGVKFNAVNATSFTFVNDNLITAVLPTAAAGTVPVLVTNATGASLPFSFNRGA